MKPQNPGRCCQCSGPFVPNPRLGDRQVTCGRLECQRLRHADLCRQWHERNREASSQHYEDVVRLFRREQPSYQRRWRLARRLREIRETIAELVEVLVARLTTVVARGRSWSGAVATDKEQTGVMTGPSLDEALAAASAITAALEQVGVGTRQLEAIGV